MMIAGTVIPHPRARITRRGRAYMPARYMEWKREAAEQLRQQWAGAEPLEGPLSIELVFFFDRPKSRRRKKTRDLVVPRMGRGDLDNSCKSVLDVLEDAGIYANDRQVSQLEASQWEAEIEPYIFIAIEPAREFPRAQPKNH
jgi:Holliday junction resolvase RusA-like endonuclease